MLKELNESLVWLEVIREGNLLAAQGLDDILEECTALCRIIAARIRTVKERGAGETRSPGSCRG